ncbi:hypothetical protein DFH09DRAFT_1155537 [Mycena vulgaris]|nr:hypothetical protein DFH09DRAFT_1155537 [Mycena vulgaris]
MKSVHFSSTNIMYSPLPWSPSPGASTSSLPPSPSAPLPPQLPESAVDSPRPAPPRQESPHTPVVPPAPVMYSPWPSPYLFGLPSRNKDSPSPPLCVRAQIHLLLSFAPFSPPNVHCDLALPLHTLNPQLTPSFLDPATYPPLPALTVMCRHLGWPIMVSASQLGGFVSVLDVFTSVVTSLRLAVRRAEYDTLPSPEARRSVDEAYFTRCRQLAGEGERQIEALKGVKRVDFLMGKTHFLGLSGPLDGVHVWELNVS